MLNKDSEIIKLVEEAVRLSEIQSGILKDMLATEGLLDDSGNNNLLNRDEAKEKNRIITNEGTKLKNRDMILAVVGTMKAGKSTIINAIVGKEVLPNRNLPMTTVPTLIRHRPGQIEPKLLFQKNEPIKALLRNIKDKISDEKMKIPKEQLAKNYPTVMNSVQAGETLKPEYHGSGEIFRFLSDFNDLVRISDELDLKFPFNSYGDINLLPLIEVEFFHLINQNEDQSEWNLTLLDTPGPNEARCHKTLTELMNKQLNNASALLLVINFTEINSEADHSVRQQIIKLAELYRGRINVMVNKFDQKDANSLDEKSTKRIVSESLMQDKVKEDNIFPVSARRAYLANCALREIDLNEALIVPENTENSWEHDFAKEAFGVEYEKNDLKLDSIRRKAAKLWDNSGFSEPLKQVISKGKTHAGFIAVDSMIDKLTDFSADSTESNKTVNNFLNIRYKSFDANISQIDKQIGNLEEKFKETGSLEIKANDLRKQIEVKVKEIIDSSFQKLKNEVIKQLNKYFTEGKLKYQNQSGNKLQNIKTSKKSKHLVGAKNIINKPSSYSDKDFDINNPEIKFDSNTNEAEIFIKRLKKSIETICKINYKKIFNELKKKLEDYDNLMNQITSDMLKILSNINIYLNEAFRKRKNDEFMFQFKLDIPSTVGIVKSFDFDAIAINFIQTEKEAITKPRRKDNVFGWLGKLLDTDEDAIFGDGLGIGWEYYTHYKNTNKINIITIKAEYEKFISDHIADLTKYCSEKFNSSLKKSIDSFFSEFKKNINKVKGTLEQTKRDKTEKEKEVQNILKTSIKKLLDKYDVFNEDLKNLKLETENIKKLFNSWNAPLDKTS
ncbi:MAG: dynamin family protein [Deltaproteobacteria bacterium]|jgi:GTPase SAR1 family protein|nr:dynamin family protein [Deltaproteobacteria bacterium]